MQFTFCCGPCVEAQSFFLGSEIKIIPDTGKNNRFPFFGCFRVFKEYPQKSQIWKSETSPNQGTWLGIPWLGLVSLCQILDFYRYSLNVLKYPIMGISFFFFLWETRRFEKWSLRGWRCFPVFPRAFDLSRVNHRMLQGNSGNYWFIWIAVHQSVHVLRNDVTGNKFSSFLSNQSFSPASLTGSPRR